MVYHVLDVSEFQSDIDFQKLKQSGIAGTILRCGYSGWGSGKTKREDSNFQSFYQAAKAAGMPVGAYYYSTATSRQEAEAEAEFTLKLLQGKQFEFPIYWDTEDSHNQALLSPSALTDVAKAYLQQVEGAGYYVGIYSYSYWLQTRLQMVNLAAYDVWVAQYNDTLDYSGAYGMWQYSSSGQISGVSGAVDLNWAYRDYPQIIQEAGLNGTGIKSPNPLTVYQSWLKERYGFSLAADGIWGPITEADSIRAIQIESGVPADGIWGPQTRAACPIIALGQANPFVWVLQGALHKFGFTIAIDGIFGSGTEAAVRAFQQKAGIAADGMAGPDTFTALFS